MGAIFAEIFISRNSHNIHLSKITRYSIASSSFVVEDWCCVISEACLNFPTVCTNSFESYFRAFYILLIFEAIIIGLTVVTIKNI